MAAILEGQSVPMPKILPPEAVQQKTRSYQREMFEESLRNNIIVAMDTGSGKTHIAILRIIWHLDKADGKLVWFLVPNVSLAKQQFNVLENALPPVNTQFLTGSTSNMQKWSNQAIWDGVLGDKEGLIVSTHQVLYDALTHGFVRMARIGLLVFDEAHHAIGSHPANRIMQDFYHPQLQAGWPVPGILGLSASPIISARVDQLRVVESNLNAITRTPVIHRAELMNHVHPPKLRIVIYTEICVQIAAVSTDKTRLNGALAPAAPVSRTHGFLDQVQLGPKFEVSSFLNNRQKYPPGYFGTRANATSIDEDFDIIDPLTGEPLKSTAIEDDDEFEHIDPLTGEPFRGKPVEQRHVPTIPRSIALESLVKIYNSMDINQDPHILSLQKANTESSARQLEKAFRTRNTLCQTQMKTLVNKAKHIFEEYGAWATDWFIREAVRKFQKMAEEIPVEADQEEVDIVDFFGGGEDGKKARWEKSEKEYLRILTKDVELPHELGPVEGRMTIKAERFIELLLEEYHAEGGSFSGLVFVEQRVGVVAMAQLLREHPQTRDLFKVATMVGSSYNTARMWYVHDLITKNEKDALEHFRNGKKNLMISTSVLEEGLDIPDCHMVVCYAAPANLKSFVQRRGRARRVVSTYIIMVPAGLDAHRMHEFENMEQEMIQIYSMEERELQEELKRQDQDIGGDTGRVFKIPSTGAVLLLDNAIPHLYHFCSCIGTQEFVDSRPDFRIYRSEEAGQGIRAEVVLPNSVHPDLRRTESATAWKNEKWAKRDAAFEAFIKLYQLGLVDDHLMPLVKTELKSDEEVQKRTPRVGVEPTLDPWSLLKKSWATEYAYSSLIRVSFPEGDTVEVQMLLLAEVNVADFILYWLNNNKIKVTIGPSKRLGKLSPELLERSRKATHLLLQPIFGTRMPADRDDFIYLFLPVEGDSWDTTGDKFVNGLEIIQNRIEAPGLVNATEPNGKFVLQRWRTDIDVFNDESLMERYEKHFENLTPGQPVMECIPLPKRRDFVHQISDNDKFAQKQSRRYEKKEFLLPEFVSVSTLPLQYSKLAMLLPCIIDRVGKAFLAADMQKSLLKSLPFLSTSMIIHATTASVAREPIDYQRLEFLGDSVLKTLTSITLFDEHPLWHEGYLAGGKDRIVSNKTLSEASMEKRLSRWIVCDQFTALKWHPHYIHSTSHIETSPKSQNIMLSTKILADVIESLIGASYLSAGFEGAMQCIALFGLHLKSWLPLSERIQGITSSYTNAAKNFSGRIPSHITSLEALLGYRFTNKPLLLEAITHLSFEADTVGMSYQRLEFLGDALLDMVIVDELYKLFGENLSHVEMHTYKAATVNAHFLAYLCMSFETEVTVPRTIKDKNGSERVVHKETKAPLYRFLRQTNQDLHQAQAQSYTKFIALKERIDKALQEEKTYPWAELLAVNAPKHLSDIVESVIAAIWIDSRGNFGVVKEFLERIGALRILRRLVRDKVQATHPLSRLGMAVVSDTIRYELKEEKEKDGTTVYGAVVRVNGEALAETVGCVSATEAKARVAVMALAVLEERKKEKKNEDKEEKKEKKNEDKEEKKNEEEVDMEVDMDISEDDVDEMKTDSMSRTQSSPTLSLKRKWEVGSGTGQTDGVQVEGVESDGVGVSEMTAHNLQTEDVESDAGNDVFYDAEE